MSLEIKKFTLFRENKVETSIKDAKKIFDEKKIFLGRYFGLEKIGHKLGIQTEKIKVPKLTISRRDLIDFKREDYWLFLLIDKDEEGNFLDINNLAKRYKQHNNRYAFCGLFWKKHKPVSQKKSCRSSQSPDQP